MATASTWTQARQRLLRELGVGQVIENGAISAFAATSMTSTKYFQNSRYGSDHYASQGYVIFRPGAASSADYERMAGDLTVSTGVLAHTGANYSDTTVGTEQVELWGYGLRPATTVLDSMNRALAKLYGSHYVAISDLSANTLDGDMSLSSTSAFTSIGSPTLSKSTTARRVPYGLRSLRVLNDTAAEGVRFPTIAMRQVRQMRMMAILCSDVAGTTLSPYDITNGATFGTSIAVSEEEPQLVIGPWEAVPTDCKEATMQGVGTTSLADVYYNAVWLYRQGNTRIELPSYITEAYQTPSIFVGRPTIAGTVNYSYDAMALDFIELEEGKDYRLVSNQPEANPNAIILRDGWDYSYPMFTMVRRPYSDFGTFSAESDTNVCPLNLLIPAAKIDLLDTYLIPRFKQEADKWAFLRTKAMEEGRQASASRPVVKAAAETPWYRGPGGGMRL